MKTLTTCEMTCCSCGTNYAMDETLKELREKDGDWFWCPNGHKQKFQNSQASQLTAVSNELKEAKKELTEAQAEIRRLKCALLGKPQKRTILQRMFNASSV